jgi:clan AA aspartic protease
MIATTNKPVVVAPNQVRRIWGDRPMGAVVVDVKLTNVVDAALAANGQLADEEVRTLIVSGLVDTGAVSSCLPLDIVEQLGIDLIGERQTSYADDSSETVPVTFPVFSEIEGRQTSDQCLVLGSQVLIGQTILETTDLFVDCTNGRLVPNPDHPDGPVTYVRAQK